MRGEAHGYRSEEETAGKHKDQHKGYIETICNIIDLLDWLQAKKFLKFYFYFKEMYLNNQYYH